mgnify:CR=1 FL=1
MLTSEEKREIDEEIHHMPTRKSACIEALKIVQRHRRWISDDSLKAIADYLEMSPDELDSVATFYNLIFRKPVGEHVIFLCDSVSCWIMGYEQIKETITNKLGISFGETTEDDLFTFLPIQCLGTCDRAPAMMIDEALYRDLTPEKVEKILDEYRDKS